MLNFTLFGAGRIGRLHAANLAASAKALLACVYDVDETAARQVAEQHGARFAADVDAALASDIDAVLIASSTDTHVDLITAAARAGKAVFCEKPIDLDITQVNRCWEAIADCGVPVQIGFNRRYDPHHRALHDAVQAGEIGSVEMMIISSRDPAPPPADYLKVSGGLFRDMMIHDFDMANFIMGEPPVTVFAVGSCLVDPEIGKAGDVDTAAVTLTYAGGRIATIRNTRRAGYGDQRLEVQGSKGMLQVGNLVENLVVKSTTEGVVSAKPVLFFLERYMPAYRAEWNAFVQALNSGAAMPVTLDDGVAALAMAEAATRSAKSGQPVRLADV